MIIGPDHYRYRDVLTERGQVIVEDVYQVIRETPGGYWVRQTRGRPLSTPEQFEYAYAFRSRGRDIHFVLKFSERRYCYPTRLEAMQSFACRKASQLKHAIHSIAKARHALAAANRIIAVGNDYRRDRWDNDIPVGMPPEFADFSFY